MIDDSWQQYLDSGNKYFYDGQWNNAKLFYFQAYDVLQQNCQQFPDCVDSLMGWIATCHNIAALFEKLGDMPLALKFVTMPNDYCQALLQGQENEELQLLAIKALNLTYRAKMNFLHQHPELEQHNHNGFSPYQHTFQHVKHVH